MHQHQGTQRQRRLRAWLIAAMVAGVCGSAAAQQTDPRDAQLQQQQRLLQQQAQQIQQQSAQLHALTQRLDAMGAPAVAAAPATAPVDGVQVVGLGALRGLEDVKVPSMISLFSYWLIALPTGYALGFWAGASPGPPACCSKPSSRSNQPERMA